MIIGIVYIDSSRQPPGLERTNELPKTRKVTKEPFYFAQSGNLTDSRVNITFIIETLNLKPEII